MSEFSSVFNASSLDGRNGVRLTGGWFSGPCGDVNGDGFSDIVVSSNEGGFGGPAFVVYGTESWASGVFNLDKLNGSNGFTAKTGVLGDNSGVAICSNTDFNGDGFADVVIGASWARPTENRAGAAYVLFGSSVSPGKLVDLSQLDGSNGFKLNGTGYGALSGASVAGGDVNGDGFGDLIIGAPNSGVGGVDHGGSAYVVFGSADPMDAVQSLASLNGTNGFRIDGEGEFGTFGTSVASLGDINGDGLGDILVGAQSYGLSPKAYVVFGAATASAASVSVSTLDGTNGFELVAPGQRIGSTVSSLGDVNADGMNDFIVGALGTNQTYVVFGSRAAFSSTVDLTALNGLGGFAIQDSTSVSAAGDVNGDGFSDILVVGSDYNAHVIFGKSGGFGSQVDPAALDGSNGFAITGMSGGILSVASADDVNADGFGDVLVTTTVGGTHLMFGHRADEAVNRVGTSISNTINGGLGNDTITALGGSDTLVGWEGRDLLRGGSGVDLLLGGREGDILVGGSGADVLDGGTGVDTADYSNSGVGVTVSLESGSAMGGDAEGDTLSNVENINGSDFRDGLSGNSLANVLTGGFGNDILRGGVGSDTLVGGAGADVLNGGGDVDTSSYADSGAAVAINLARGTGDGGDATGDTLIGIENVIGSGLDDNLFGSGQANTLSGGSGADVIKGLGGIDTLMGGAGSDTLVGGAGADVLNGGGDVDISSYADSGAAVAINLARGTGDGGDAAGDTLIGVENVIGSGFDDNLFGSGQANTLSGGSGADVVKGLGGIDTLVGGAGADVLNGGGGSDRFDFNDVGDSGLRVADRDVISDFQVALPSGSDFVDQLDFSTIDARAGAVGNQAFVFIGDGTFTAEGQIRATQVENGTLVELNVSGVDGAEMTVLLINIAPLALEKADFIL